MLLPHGKKVSLLERISHLDFLPNRKPEMAFSGGAEKAFAEISEYRDGAIYVATGSIATLLCRAWSGAGERTIGNGEVRVDLPHVF